MCTAIALLAAACQEFFLRPRTPHVRVMGACPPTWAVPASPGGSAVPSNRNGADGAAAAETGGIAERRGHHRGFTD